MRNLAAVVAPLLLLASTAIAAQPTASTHEQHQATGQHQATVQPHGRPGEKACCCEQMMREMHGMMSEMHKMHQGMEAHSDQSGRKNQSPEDKK